MRKMKMMWMGLAILLLAGGVLAGSSLIFDEKDGLAEKIEVQSYDGRKEAVKVRCVSGITNRPLSSFSEEVRKKILGWWADKEFKSSAGLRIDIEKVRERKPYEVLDRNGKKRATKTGEIETVLYEITLKNKASIPIENIKLEWRVFMKKVEEGRKVKRCKRATFTCDSIGPNEMTVLRTYPVEIRDIRETHPQVGSSWSGYTGGSSTDIIQDKLEGLSLCVSKRDRSGGIIEREYKNGNPPKKDKWLDYR